MASKLQLPMYKQLRWKCIEARYFQLAEKQQKSPIVQLNTQDIAKAGARHLR